MSNDQTRAFAIEAAERHLVKMGWKFSMTQLGVAADEIIAAMDKAASDRQPKVNSDAIADEAMKTIWNSCLSYFRPNVRDADQQAFYEIAQPIMRDLANKGKSNG